MFWIITSSLLNEKTQTPLGVKFLVPLMFVDIWIIINDSILSPFVCLNCLFDEQKASQIRGCLCFQTVTIVARPETSLWSQVWARGRGSGKVLTGTMGAEVINGHTDTSIITHSVIKYNCIDILQIKITNVVLQKQRQRETHNRAF